MGAALVVPLEQELERRLPHARLVPAAGGPLEGSVQIATELARSSLSLPADAAMLYVVSPKRG
jgi:hypothetical protein